jgi:hypothetical protein
MVLEELTLMFFMACNSIRIFAYIPQMRTAVIDKNGASAISYTTWSLFLVANASTVAYALVNRADWSLAACFIGNALCCGVILAITFLKRRQYARRLALVGPSPSEVPHLRRATAGKRGRVALPNEADLLVI